MRRIAFPLVLIALWVSAQTSAAASPETSTSGSIGLSSAEIDDAVAQLSKITGLAPLKKVQSATITREGVRKFLEQKLKEEVKPEEIQQEELAMKRFGLLPEKFDLKAATVDLITEQAAAFYDFRTKKLYMLEGEGLKDPAGESLGKSGERMIIVHELAHALADQHFDLGKFIRKSRSDDSSTARMAVMEGQATWLMMETMMDNAGQSMRKMPGMVDMMGSSATEAMASQYPVLASSPLYLRTSLIFPYNQGLRFQQAVVQKLGNAGFSEVFRKPPVSSQQVLHPDKYFAKLEPLKVQLPEGPKNYKLITEGTVGELEHSVLLEQYLTKHDADEIAPAWRGARLALFENKTGKSVTMLYASEWDSPASAKRYFDAYRKVLAGKWKSMNIGSESDSSVTGTGDVGPFTVTLEGTRVTSVEGAVN